MRPDFRLYLITDRTLTPGLESAVEEALSGGVKAVQLREKDMPVRELLETAKRLRKITREYGAMLFINDRVDAALAAEADGVHLGGTSMPPQAVRKICGGGLMIGVSTHSLEEARQAESEGADFITFGPVYETPSKMKYGSPVGLKRLREAVQKIFIPVYALGGIKLPSAPAVLDAGAHGIALISAIFGAGGAEDIKREAEKFMELEK